MKQRIAIVAWGDSPEYEISALSASQLEKELGKDIYESYIVKIRDNKWTVQGEKETEINRKDFSFNRGNEKISFDCVLMAIHGTPGEDGKLQSYFEMIGMPFTGSGAFSSALSFNKYACKSYLSQWDVPMAKSILLRSGNSFDTAAILAELGLPLFVKPNNSGSSFGISRVNMGEELEDAITSAFKEGDEVIVEQYINGTEVSCGLIKTAEQSHIFPITEIVTENEFFDFEAKYTDGMAREITPAVIEEKTAAKCRELSSLIYDSLSCRGIARVDFIISSGTPYFLEVNTIPGMSPNSIIPKQIKSYGMKLSEILDLSIQDAIRK